MNRAGLEWTYRLAQEPRRLADRYLIGNPVFLARTLRPGARHGKLAPHAAPELVWAVGSERLRRDEPVRVLPSVPVRQGGEVARRLARGVRRARAPSWRAACAARG